MRGGDLHLHGVLGALPRVLHPRVPRAQHHQVPAHRSRLPFLLLARDGKFLCQPDYILLDERQVIEKKYFNSAFHASMIT